MKKNYAKLKTAILFVATMLLLAACSKTGPTGPAGPAGPQGPAGSPNVIYSEWFKPATYAMNLVYSVYTYHYDKAAPGITQDILDKGVVLTYGKLLGYNHSIWPVTQVSQLPITVHYKEISTIQTDTWSALISVGNLRIQFTNDNNRYTTDDALTPEHMFRYIIIPGGKTGERRAAPDVDFNDYHAVCRYYNIPE